MTLFIDNIKSAFDTVAHDEKRDAGELVSFILTIAGFAIVALLAVNWLGTAVLNKAADVGACIEGSNTYTQTSSANGTACAKGTGGMKSFKDDAGYKGRIK